jgi:hypothetical protein
MRLVPVVPRIVSDLVSQAVNSRSDTRTYQNAKNFLSNAQRVAIAAAVCFAAYKGSVIAAGALATISIPATTLAAGVMAVKYGCTALKAGVVAKQLSQAAIGAAALYAGWQALDNRYLISSNTTNGLFDGHGKYSITNLSRTIVNYLTKK